LISSLVEDITLNSHKKVLGWFIFPYIVQKSSLLC